MAKTVTVKWPSKIYMACCEAAQIARRPRQAMTDSKKRRMTKERERRKELDRQIDQWSCDPATSMEDRLVIADYHAGKLNPKGGRPEDLHQQRALHSLASEVEQIKSEERARGVRIRHDDAIDRVIEKYFPEMLQTAAWSKLKNFISRSKRTKKLAQ